MIEEDALREEEVGMVKDYFAKARSARLTIVSRRDAGWQPSSTSSRGRLAAQPSYRVLLAARGRPCAL